MVENWKKKFWNVLKRNFIEMSAKRRYGFRGLCLTGESVVNFPSWVRMSFCLHIANVAVYNEFQNSLFDEKTTGVLG
ncbi:MAG TPA: hypothetical protein DDE71_04170 [Tenacibaculum sp.]|nr:hypothetical protein [Tenacibaculum sp.]